MATSTARKIAVVTGSRADYGLLRGTMRSLSNDRRVTLQVIVTGAHLAPQFGETWREIESDGFPITARVDIGAQGDTRPDTALSTGRALAGIAEVLDQHQPDLLLVLGDRFEIFAAAAAAHLLGIPVAHIHGGEITEGAFDDALRHAITKLSCLHFPAAEPYARRLEQMGEIPERIFTVGAPGLDGLAEAADTDSTDLFEELGIKWHGPFFLITLHPETMQLDQTAELADAMLRALATFPEYYCLFTGVNADPSHEIVAAAIEAFVQANPGRASLHKSLGRQRYAQALKNAAVVVGNSSSGIIEAPAFATPTVNIGDRQKGRLRPPSIIDCPSSAPKIRDAITLALSPAFRTGFAAMAPPYGRPGASARIAEILAKIELIGLAQKHFNDI